VIVASPPTLNEGEYGAGNEQQQPEPRKRSIGGILASTGSVLRKIPVTGLEHGIRLTSAYERGHVVLVAGFSSDGIHSARKPVLVLTKSSLD
jgi:hypothetical protein